MPPPGDLVSVIIPCYQQGHLLAEAIRSALAQTYRPLEVIVVDDGSPDNTAAVARGFGDAVRYVRRDNGKQGAARNTGIDHARGEYLLFLDADDALAPDSVARHLEALGGPPRADITCGGWDETDAAGVILCTHPPPRWSADVYHQLLRDNAAPPCCFLVRRRGLDTIGVLDPSLLLTGHEDWDLWLRAAAAGLVFTATPDASGIRARYRRHPGTTSANVAAMRRSRAAVLRKQHGVHRRCTLCRAIIRRGIRTSRLDIAWSLWLGLVGDRSARGIVAFFSGAWNAWRHDLLWLPSVLCWGTCRLAGKLAGRQAGERGP